MPGFFSEEAAAADSGTEEERDRVDLPPKDKEGPRGFWKLPPPATEGEEEEDFLGL